MSGLVSGITKVFSSLGTGAAKLGSAVRAAGATLFTAGAATGGGLTTAATQGSGLSKLLGGGGVLGSVLGGAVNQAMKGGLIGGIMGQVAGTGFGTGFKQGAIAGGVTGGVESLFSPTGVPGVDPTTTGSVTKDPLVTANSPTGVTPNTGGGFGRFGGGMTGKGVGQGFGDKVADFYSSAPASTVPTVPVAGTTTAATEGGGGMWKGLGNFLNTNAGAAMIGGIGEALGTERQAELLAEMREADRKFLREKEQRITESYAGAGEAVAGSTPWAGDPTPRPTPAAKWAYNPNTGMIDMAV